MEREGVIQFHAAHTHAPLDAALAPLVAELVGWRAVLVQLALVGQDPARYGGYGFGNLSVQVPAAVAARSVLGGARGPRGQHAPFVVTGTQTGGMEHVGADEHALVTSWDVRNNRVTSSGRTLPSSEALTHGAVYEAVPGARAVVHVHAPAIFTRAAELGLPCTSADVGYGTVAMAHEVSRLWRDSDLREQRVFAMLGHEDGVVSFGSTLDEAAGRLLAVLARALAPPGGRERSRRTGG